MKKTSLKGFTRANFLKKNLNGFTLIELLIVIALLGALAVGLLAALDPFEQLKKGTDTGVRNLVSEVHGAVIRFYAIRNNMPWCPAGTNPGAGEPACLDDPVGNNLDEAPIGPQETDGTALHHIVDTGELKEDFSDLARNSLGRVFVTGSQTNSTVTVCYRPTSRAFLADPNSQFDIQGAITPCVTTNLETCFWCVR